MRGIILNATQLPVTMMIFSFLFGSKNLNLRAISDHVLRVPYGGRVSHSQDDLKSH